MMGEMSEPKITPLARRLAEENGIDWRRIEGTGPEGEITERDILNFLAKVMAGEITLEGPPPGEPPPPEGEADLEAAREALAKEGLDLKELIPESPAPSETAEFELDLDLEEEEAAPPREVVAWSEETIVEEVTSEFPEPEEPAPADVTAELPLTEPPPGEPTAELPIFEEEPAPAEAEPETDITAELPVFTEEAPAEAEAEAAPSAEATAELPVFAEEAEEAAPPVTREEEAAPPVTREEEAPPAPAAAEVALAFRLVELGALDALLADFGAELGGALPRAALLFLAARRALADLEVPLRPLKEGFSVAPSQNLVEFFRRWEEASEPGDGLRLYEGADLALVPPALGLTDEGLPQGQGLLVLAGELPTDRRKFLERVAHYLEHPVRLLLFR